VRLLWLRTKKCEFVSSHQSKGETLSTRVNEFARCFKPLTKSEKKEKPCKKSCSLSIQTDTFILHCLKLYKYWSRDCGWHWPCQENETVKLSALSFELLAPSPAWTQDLSWTSNHLEEFWEWKPPRFQLIGMSGVWESQENDGILDVHPGAFQFRGVLLPLYFFNIPYS